MKNKFLSTHRPIDILEDPDTFQVALFAYFGMSDKAIMSSMRHMTKNKIAYRLSKARNRFNVAIKRADYRDGHNRLAQRVIGELKPWSEQQLKLEYLR